MTASEIPQYIEQHGVLSPDQKIVGQYSGISLLTRRAVPAIGKAKYQLRKKVARTAASGSDSPKDFQLIPGLEPKQPDCYASIYSSSIRTNNLYPKSLSSQDSLAATSDQEACSQPEVLYQATVMPSAQSYMLFYLIVLGLLSVVGPLFFLKGET